MERLYGCPSWFLALPAYLCSVQPPEGKQSVRVDGLTRSAGGQAGNGRGKKCQELDFTEALKIAIASGL